MPIDPQTRVSVRTWLAEHETEARTFMLQEAVETVWMPRQAPAGVPGDDHPPLYDFVANTLGDVPLTYLEFGVAGGGTMRLMLERFRHAGARFFGFDSFEGLPEDWTEPRDAASTAHFVPRGTFSQGGVPPAIADPRVKFVKGWFQNTLPSFLGGNPLGGVRPVLVHLDADLYSSTLFILASLWQTTSEFYFIFDEFFGEELVALRDFMNAFPVDIKFLCQTNADSLPLKVFGHLRRVPLEI